MNDDIETLAWQVAEARGAQWLTITYSPKDEQFPWAVAVETGFPGKDGTTHHAATLAEALRQRLAR